MAAAAAVYPSTLNVLLRTNPTVSDKALAGVVEANLVGFTGVVSVATKVHRFATGDKLARVIYITPYDSFADFLVNLKRVLVGVEFPQIENNGTHISGYVLGLLPINSPAYNQARREAETAFNQGRRFILAITNDCRDLGVYLEPSSGCVLI